MGLDIHHIRCQCGHDLIQHEFHGGTSPQDDWSIEDCKICNCPRFKTPELNNIEESNGSESYE